MRRPSSTTLLRIASVLAILGLALMVWGTVDQTPLPVILAMSVGQGFGILSFLLYLVVVVIDLRRAKVFDEKPPS